MNTYNEEWLAHVLESIGDGVITTDTKGNITFVNKITEELIGCPNTECIGKAIEKTFILMDNETGRVIDSPIFMVLQTCDKLGLRNNTVLVRRDGKKSFISASISPLLIEDELKGTVIIFRDITRIKENENKLEQKSQIIEQSPVSVIMTDIEGNIEYVNDTFSRVTGYEKDEVYGKNTSILKSGEQTIEFYKEMWETIRRGITWKGQFHNRKKNGEYFWEDATISPIRNNTGRITNYVAIKEDITVKKLIEESLAKSNLKYQTLFTNMSDAFVYQKIITDKEGKPSDCLFLEVNQAFETLVNLKRENIIGKRLTGLKEVLDILGYSSLKIEDWLEVCYRIAIEGKQLKTEVYSKPNKSWYSATVYSPQRGYFSAIISNITETKQTEEQLRKAKEVAEEASRTKSEFLANMSHEIRTPLNGIKGMIDLTMLTNLDSEQKENLEIASSCADVLLNVINDILDFSKIEAGKLEVEHIGFQVREMIKKAVKSHEQKAKSKGIKIRCSISQDIPHILIGDPTRIQQILNNLIGNAVKFTENGLIEIIVKNYEITQNKTRLVFKVKDTGIGISEEEQKLLFRSFTQVDSTITRKYGGTGLGLAISKRLIELMDGDIWMESKKGEGSAFSFSIELGYKGDFNTLNSQNNANNTYKTEGSLRVLLAEDNKTNQMVVSSMLNKRGYSLTCVDNGSEVLEELKRTVYDIILMDIQMPEMDGLEATKLIREGEKGSSSHIPIIAVTAYALKGDKEKFLKAGMDDYISKPIDINILYKTLEKYEKKKKETDVKLYTQKKDLNEISAAGITEDGDNSKIINKISEYTERLKMNISDGNMQSIEQSAHLIKTLAQTIENENIKKSAFKIELSGRKGKLEGINELYNNLLHEIEKI